MALLRRLFAFFATASEDCQAAPQVAVGGLEDLAAPRDGGAGRAAPPGAVSFVHIADPQLGLKTHFTEDCRSWPEERAMLDGLVRAAVRGGHRLVLVGGDMQDLWPNEGGVGRNPCVRDEPTLDLGLEQRADVRAALAPLDRAGASVRFTAGNHDVGDVPDEVSLATYVREWGPLQEAFAINGVPCLQLTAQLYWARGARGLEARRREQTAWLAGQLEAQAAAVKAVRRLVVLTHIPPFMERHDEGSGWANWAREDRLAVLELMAAKLGGAPEPVRVLWLCGHFHTNVENLGYQYQAPAGGRLVLDVVVTSAAGTTMFWDDNGGSFGPAEAARVATKSVQDAFVEDIVRAKGGPDALLQPYSNRSGLRTVWLARDGAFGSQWSTLQELERGA